MDHAQGLIRMVVRAFYSTRHVLVLDALMLHSTLWVDDLASVMSMNTKELRKLCSLLREDKLISVHNRQEIKDGQGRPQNKEYYYINYHMAIDAIKLRIVRLEKRIRDLYRPTKERKDWHCQRCNAEFTEMEVLHRFDERLGGFACLRCGSSLDRNEVSAADRAGSERSSRLMLQLERLVGSQGILREIDNVDVPNSDFEEALSRHKPIERSDTSPGVKWEPVKKEATHDIVHGVKVEAPEIQVSFTTQQETERAEAAQKRLKLEQQEKNALPEWHLASTISGQKTLLGSQEDGKIKEIKENLGTDPGDNVGSDVKPATDDNEYISQYYRELEEAKVDEARRVQEEEEGDEDDDFDDFEDVLETTGTPASTASTTAAGTKRKMDDNSEWGSGVGTAASTPAVAESPSKRIKMEDDFEGEKDDGNEDDGNEDDGNEDDGNEDDGNEDDEAFEDAL